MNSSKTIFSQLMNFLPQREFRRIILKFSGNKGVKDFSCWDQLLCMAFAQLTYRDSLRDIEACLRAIGVKRYHLGFRCKKISRSTLAEANEKRDWKIYAALAQILITEARTLYANDSQLGIDLKAEVYAFDASIIDLCLSVFPWATFRRNKAAIKLHTLLDLKTNIPTFIEISAGSVHEVKMMNAFIPEQFAYYIMDRGFLDFKRLYKLHQTPCYFIIRSKNNTCLKRLYSRVVDRSSGVRSDHIVIPASLYTRKKFPANLRRIRYYDSETKVSYEFLTNDLHLDAITICKLYKARWKVELFFKWIKQHLKIKSFFGTSENAVKTQIWIAVSVYVLVAIVRKKLKIGFDLYTVLQIFSVTLFEKMPILQAFQKIPAPVDDRSKAKQLNLFEI
jgi:hypothetical protein